MNTQLIIGYVGGDPRITDFNDGGKVAQFTIGVTKKGYTTKDGRQVPDHTEWFNVVARNAQAKVVEGYVHKGERLFVAGETKTRQYTAQDGTLRNITEVIVEKLELLGGKPQGGGQFAPIDQPTNPTATAPVSQDTAVPSSSNDDLPF